MGSTERREREKQGLRRKILEAARAMFLDEGYEAVTMRRIASRIEYSPTALYGYFPDKAALLREMCDEDFLALAQGFSRIARIADPVERLRQAGLAYADFGMRHPHHYRLMFMTPGLPAKGDLSRLARGNPEEDAYAFVRFAVVEGLDAGLFREELKDVDLVAQTVWAALHGVVALHIAKGQDDWVPWRPVKRRVAMAIDAMLRGVLRREA